MRVGFDIGPITAARSGIGNYCLYLLRELISLKDIEVAGFAASARQLDLAAIGTPIPHRQLHIPTRVMYTVWSLFKAPKVDGLLGGVDVYHATNYFLPPTRRAKRVLTIHDIAFKKHPELCSPKIVGPFSAKVGGFASEADAVIADSESTRQDIIEMLDVPAERVHTIHLAADPGLTAMQRTEARERVREAFALDGPFALFVGTIEPRKNILGLLHAFKRIQAEVPHSLVIAGGQGWLSPDAWADLTKELTLDHVGRKRSGKRVEMLGHVSQRDLTALYSAADAFVFPSFYEGFGLPLLEAMACGCPVVTADNSSLPEVGGDAVEYCDANDLDSIADAMLRVLSDESLRQQMAQRGLAQAAKFSWRKTAEQTAAVYRSVCQ